jgi:hypothetical protein
MAWNKKAPDPGIPVWGVVDKSAGECARDKRPRTAVASAPPKDKWGLMPRIGSGRRIRTSDLRVMGPMSCQTALPRVNHAPVASLAPRVPGGGDPEGLPTPSNKLTATRLGIFTGSGRMPIVSPYLAQRDCHLAWGLRLSVRGCPECCLSRDGGNACGVEKTRLCVRWWLNHRGSEDPLSKLVCQQAILRD